MASETAHASERMPTREAAAAVARHPIAMWIAFLVVHIWLGWLCLNADGLPLGDVTLVYKPWAQQAETGMAVVGITAPWVYPPLAIVPIMVPLLVGAAQYAGGWLTMVLLFDAAAFAVLTISRGRRATAAAWWWLAFLVLLGPIAIARLDAVSVAIVVVGLLWLHTRPRVAAVLLAVATWIKVWPAALIGAVFVVSRDRWRMLMAVFATSLVVVILVLTFGGASNLFSFVTQQTGRGLQIEAPISLPWMWSAAAHQPGSFVYYDRNILTFQVTGPGIDTAIALMTPLLAIAVVIVLMLGIRATYRGAPALVVLPPLSLALVVTLIAFNKVGSPQYIAWLAAPVILGIVCNGKHFRAPAILVGITAALTQIVYPYLYVWLLYSNPNPLMLGVLTIRNVMEFVVLGCALWLLWRSPNTAEALDLDAVVEFDRATAPSTEPVPSTESVPSTEPVPSTESAPFAEIEDRKE